MNNYQQEIRDLISTDKVLEAINLFYEEEKSFGITNEIIILKSNLISLERKVLAGILSFDEEVRLRNKIKFELLDLIAKADHFEAKEINEKDTFSFENAGLESKIEKLTNDQLKVLNFIKKMKRVRICGSAGSGKTLVAIEKAIRLAKKGLSVILLCHNPNLSNKIKQLVNGTDVFVISFGQFIRNLNEFNNLFQLGWNKYHEPMTEELEKALQIIESKNIQFDAVIVDEAQDFREDWWLVVDAILLKGENQILYLFHDDNQALLPYRSIYPIEEPIVDLSKNCRNAGKIHEFIKSNFHYQAPETSIEVKDLGRVKLFVYTERKRLKSKVFQAINWMKTEKRIASPVILLAGDLDINKWEFGSVSCSIPSGIGWKKEIMLRLKMLFPNIDLKQKFKRVSGSIVPSEEDVNIIVDFAVQEYNKIDMNYILSKLGTKISNLSQVKWIKSTRKATLDCQHEDPIVMGFFLLKFLSNPDWAKDLQKEETYNFTEKFAEKSDEIPVFETSSFKGLEAEGVILVTKGRSFSYFNELYVGSSRAKKVLAIVIDKENESFHIP